MMDEDPAPMLGLFPGTNLGKDYMRLRVNPMIGQSPTLRMKVPLGRPFGQGQHVEAEDRPRRTLLGRIDLHSNRLILQGDRETASR